MSYYLGLSTVENYLNLVLFDSQFQVVDDSVVSLGKFQQSILQSIDFLLVRHRLNLSQIKAFIINTGPSKSFTSTRLSVAVIKTMALVLKIKVYETSTHELMFNQFFEQAKPFETYAVVLEGHQNSVFVQVYQNKSPVTQIEDVDNAKLVKYLTLYKKNGSGELSIISNVVLQGGFIQQGDLEFIAKHTLDSKVFANMKYFRFTKKQPVALELIQPQYYRKTQAQVLFEKKGLLK